MKKLYRDEMLSLGGDLIMELNIETRVEIAKELGDVLWYVTAVASDLGFDLDEIATMNIDKLHSRKRRGRLRGVVTTDDTHSLRPRVEWLPRRRLTRTLHLHQRPRHR